MNITENCLFINCMNYKDLLWIHKDAKYLWKTVEDKCDCKFIKEGNKDFEIKTCSYNIIIKIELVGGDEY